MAKLRNNSDIHTIVRIISQNRFRVAASFGYGQKCLCYDFFFRRLWMRPSSSRSSKRTMTQWVHRLGDGGRPLLEISVIIFMDLWWSASAGNGVPQVMTRDIRLWRISALQGRFVGTWVTRNPFSNWTDTLLCPCGHSSCKKNSIVKSDDARYHSEGGIRPFFKARRNKIPVMLI